MAVTNSDITLALDAGHLGRYPIQPQARPFLAAQLLQRATERATSQDPFVLGLARTPGDVINRAALDLGLLIGHRHTSDNRHTLGFWQWRAGFSLAPL